MDVGLDGTINIDEIKDTHGREVVGIAKQYFMEKLIDGDYLIDLKNKVIINIADGDIQEVGTFDWSVSDMEYNFDYINEEEEEF